MQRPNSLAHPRTNPALWDDIMARLARLSGLAVCRWRNQQGPLTGHLIGYATVASRYKNRNKIYGLRTDSSMSKLSIPETTETHLSESVTAKRTKKGGRACQLGCSNQKNWKKGVVCRLCVGTLHLPLTGRWLTGRLESFFSSVAVPEEPAAGKPKFSSRGRTGQWRRLSSAQKWWFVERQELKMEMWKRLNGVVTDSEIKLVADGQVPPCCIPWSRLSIVTCEL